MDLSEAQTLLNELLKHYELTEEDLNKPVSDSHVEGISRSSCKHWKSLPAHLGLKPITAEDSDRKHIDPAEKRYDFFLKWKEMKGSGATYKQLIIALVKIDCREDAEAVCAVLKGSVQPHPQPSAVGASSDSNVTPVPTSSGTAGRMLKVSEVALIVTPTLDPKVKGLVVE